MLSLIAKLGLDKTGFDAGMASAGKQVNKFGSDLKGALAGAFGIAALTAFTKNLIDTVSHINDLSERLGVSAEGLQEMEYAAKQTGASLDTVASAFRNLSKNRLEAMQNSGGDQAQVFSAMGISGPELKAQNLETIFKRIAAAIQTTDFGASELAMVEKLLGRSAGELLPMFKAGLQTSAEEARRLGLVIDEGMVQKIDDIGDSIDRISTKFKTVMAPAVGFVADRIRDMFDLGDILVGNIGAIAGTLLGGGSIEDAREAGRQHVFDVLDRREKEDAIAEQKKERRAAGLPADEEAKRIAKEFQFKEAASPNRVSMDREKASKGFSVSETAFGRIGAFTGAAAGASLPPGQAQQIQLLQRVYDSLSKGGIVVKDVRR